MVTRSMHFPAPVFPSPKSGSSAQARDHKAEATDLFLNAMLDTPVSRFARRNPLEWVASLIFHAFVVGAILMVPFYFTDTIDIRSFTQTFLVGPAPPGPPPPPPAAAAPQKIVRAPLSRLVQSGRLMAPTAVPRTILMLKEAPLPADSGSDGVIGGVPGGVPGGQLGGVLGGIIGGTGRASAAAMPVVAPPPAVKRILRVGGDIKPPRPISTPAPEYPALAKSARVQGVVEIEAIIDEQGDVASGHAVSGPGLLIAAALQTVSEWKYEPTLLNGVPVSVEMRVYVRFSLH